MAIMMQKCPAVVRDAVITDNLVIFNSCSVCNLTVIVCDYPFPKPPGIEKQIRYSLLVLTVFVEVATMNDSNGPAIGLRFKHEHDDRRLHDFDRVEVHAHPQSRHFLNQKQARDGGPAQVRLHLD